MKSLIVLISFVFVSSCFAKASIVRFDVGIKMIKGSKTLESLSEIKTQLGKSYFIDLDGMRVELFTTKNSSANKKGPFRVASKVIDTRGIVPTVLGKSSSMAQFNREFKIVQKDKDGNILELNLTPKR